MGSNVVNLSLKGTTQHVVTDAISSLFPGHDCFVSPNSQNWVSVFDAAFESFAIEAIIETARALSRGCSASALLAAVYDSDVLMLWVIDPLGNVVAEYNSCPDYFESEINDQEVPVDRIAEAVSALSNPPVMPKLIADALQSDDVFLEEALTTLGGLLGVRFLAWNYDTLADCGAESCPDFERFIRVT
ncbi:MAG TPA: hypothetical protein VGN12_29585 [Pirellulales bacterium]|jgi:hypothetical protein